MSLADAPKEIDGHGLLNGKVVVVTAAAGTGIGSAVARRALAEGADVVVSDHHERRLGETRDQLAGLGLGRVESVVCDVTSTAQVDALDLVDDRPDGPSGRAGQQRRAWADETPVVEHGPTRSGTGCST